MNTNYRIQKLRDRRYDLMNYRQLLISIFNISPKKTFSEFYQEMEEFETKCAIVTATGVFIKKYKGK